ncbi:hypothetical protein HYH03_013730 [Edaphochlamys debaryana]|uniref:Uncharacterized protein n=1 Tax=Edaphochlamys debaryana TaxID=47281 RepID=A0A835XT49_9CHLO|nr:hypothetical protein HYH03_013730 [Edaphochlamys debaryana]|eukprot:KAG2487731.1 hypothetical protein HYH03_013730 [Edaphochlamys debaryana]
MLDPGTKTTLSCGGATLTHSTADSRTSPTSSPARRRSLLASGDSAGGSSSGSSSCSSSVGVSIRTPVSSSSDNIASDVYSTYSSWAASSGGSAGNIPVCSPSASQMTVATEVTITYQVPLSAQGVSAVTSACASGSSSEVAGLEGISQCSVAVPGATANTDSGGGGQQSAPPPASHSSNAGVIIGVAVAAAVVAAAVLAAVGVVVQRRRVQHRNLMIETERKNRDYIHLDNTGQPQAAPLHRALATSSLGRVYKKQRHRTSRRGGGGAADGNVFAAVAAATAAAASASSSRRNLARRSANPSHGDAQDDGPGRSEQQEDEQPAVDEHDKDAMQMERLESFTEATGTAAAAVRPPPELPEPRRILLRESDHGATTSVPTGGGIIRSHRRSADGPADRQRPLAAGSGRLQGGARLLGVGLEQAAAVAAAAAEASRAGATAGGLVTREWAR